MVGLAALLALVSAHTSLAASTIATFSDSNCKDSLDGFDGPNGYPNGTCTKLSLRSSPYGSFQVVALDPGCTVTIYAEDFTGDICSGPSLEIEPINCYNSTYVYYSIDYCDPYATTTSLSLPTAPTSSSRPSSGSNNTTAIIAGVVGGVVGLIVGIVVGLVAYIFKRRQARKKAQDNPGQVFELVTDRPKEEKELPAHEGSTARYAMQPLELEAPPVELADRGPK